MLAFLFKTKLHLSAYMDLTNKTIWITGASSGIGEELARQLAAQGVTLILTARNAEKLEALASFLRTRGAVCYLLAADLYQLDTLEALTRKALQFTGNIHIVIHSAGISQRSLAQETDLKVYHQLMDINFFAPVYITRYLLPHFIEKNNGHIVVLSSVAGLMGFPLRSGYSAAKHAVKGYFETLQTETHDQEIYTTLVYPGRINTPISVSSIKGDGSAHGKMDDGQLNGIPVHECASRIISAIHARKKRVVIAKGERLLWWFWFLAHPLYQAISFKKGMSK